MLSRATCGPCVWDPCLRRSKCDTTFRPKFSEIDHYTADVKHSSFVSSFWTSFFHDTSPDLLLESWRFLRCYETVSASAKTPPHLSRSWKSKSSIRMLHATNDDELAVGCQRIFTSLSTRVSTKLSVVESTGRNALKKPVAPKDSKRMNKARPARLEPALPTLSFKQCRVRQWPFPASRCSALSTHASVPEMWFVLDHVPAEARSYRIDSANGTATS